IFIVQSGNTMFPKNFRVFIIRSLEFGNKFLKIRIKTFRFKQESIFEIENILKREEALDRFKWDWIDEEMTFEYFSFEVVISILLKLRIVDRWINADPEIGKKLFVQLLEDIKADSKKEI
ncbi:DUF2764 domain-containing protein, partial [Odoribacter sp. OttesenSCG-928-L07]|nr:DUF2764 domain-containing protein [Odoribacter sp. OttesenSCG-928-L07]